MAADASPHTSRRSRIDRGPFAAVGIADIASAQRFVAQQGGNLLVGPRQRLVMNSISALRAPVRQRIGRFEQMVTGSQQLSPIRSRIVGVLLEAANHSCCGGIATLRPLWANETMHRAYQMVRLIRLLDDRIPCRDYDTAAADLEWRIACALAETLRSLRIAHDSKKLPCSGVVRDVVRDLVELFSGAMSVSGVLTSIEPMELASFKRRALVLMAGHLVIELLFCALRERCTSKIVVTLDRPSHCLGRLEVGYDQRVVPFGPLDGGHGVIDDLADLLESDVMYRAAGTRIGVCVEFPLR